jgi:hypothetical protein
MLLGAASLAVVSTMTVGAPAPRNISAGYDVPLALPFGVASADGKVGYFLGEKDGLEAVNLATGESLWKTRPDAFPLAVWDRKLVVLMAGRDRPHHVRVVMLDGDGEAVQSSPDIELAGYAGDEPGWVHARAFLDGDDLLLDWWIYWEAKGDVKRKGGDTVAGVTRVNLKTGKAVALDEVQRGALRPPLKQWDGLAEGLKDLPNDTNFAGGQSWYAEPKCLFDGGRIAVLWRTPIDKDEIMTLRTWDAGTGKDAQTTKLLRREYGCHMNHSPDGRYLFLQHERVGDADDLYRHAWEVYRVATGQRLGTFVHNSYCIDAGVVGDRAFVVEERPDPNPQGAPPIRELFAHDLKTGKTLWTRPAPAYRTALLLCGK